MRFKNVPTKKAAEKAAVEAAEKEQSSSSSSSSASASSSSSGSEEECEVEVNKEDEHVDEEVEGKDGSPSSQRRREMLRSPDKQIKIYFTAQ